MIMYDIHSYVACCVDGLRGVASTQPVHDAQYLLNAVQERCQEDVIDYQARIAISALF